jgi:hypothetical protein
LANVLNAKASLQNRNPRDGRSKYAEAPSSLAKEWLRGFERLLPRADAPLDSVKAPLEYVMSILRGACPSIESAYTPIGAQSNRTDVVP